MWMGCKSGLAAEVARFSRARYMFEMSRSSRRGINNHEERF